MPKNRENEIEMNARLTPQGTEQADIDALLDRELGKPKASVEQVDFSDAELEELDLETELSAELSGEISGEIAEIPLDDRTSVASPTSTFGPDPDGPLATKFLAGSDEAFVQLYAKYEAPLLLYCRRMMVNERMAEDAFQEIWIRIFELRQRAATSTTTVGGVERPAGLEIACFKALLFRSARNLCLNTLRLEKYRAGSSEALEEIVATDESSRDTELSEMKTLIKKALARLPFEQREAFVLHEYSGYSYAEIAEMMGTSEQNVKVRAYRARLRLRKVISSWLGLGEDDDPTNSL